MKIRERGALGADVAPAERVRLVTPDGDHAVTFDLDRDATRGLA